jgi:hypothetical protein
LALKHAGLNRVAENFVSPRNHEVTQALGRCTDRGLAIERYLDKPVISSRCQGLVATLGTLRLRSTERGETAASLPQTSELFCAA